jgi:putative peptidoglycan lipid II flippase
MGAMRCTRGPVRATMSGADGGQSKGEAARAAEAERRKITGRAGIVAAGTLTSRLLGLVRDQVLAAIFSRAATDAFFVAFTIPNVLRQLLAEGAVQNAVLPVLAKTREESGEARAKELFAALRGLSLAVLTLVTVGGVVFAPALVELFAGGFKNQPGQFERTVLLTRWVFPYIFFMGTAALGVAALNVHQRFVATSFAPALLNVAFVLCALILPARLGARGTDPILALAAGVLLGGALQVVAQWPSLRAIGYLALPRLDLTLPGVREALRRMGPVLVGLGIYYVDVVLARRFLSELGLGAQSYFGWALRLCDFPQGIFVMALQSATLPSLALLVARGEQHEVSKTFAVGMRLSLFVALASTVMFVALAEPLVVVIFQRGQFDALSSQETAKALAAQGLGIWMVAAVRQLVSVYYALGDTRTPVVVAALDLGVFIALALGLRGSLGHVGISLAVTGASAAQMLLLWMGLRSRLPDTRLGEIAASAARTLLAAVPAALAGRALARLLAAPAEAGQMRRLLPGLCALGTFALLFLALAWLARSPELGAVVDGVLRRQSRRRA